MFCKLNTACGLPRGGGNDPESEQLTLSPVTSAMQGDFAEHIAALQAISSKDSPIHAVAVRTPAELEPCQGLILPGGESTTMALLINASGLYDPIKQFVSDAKEGKNGKAVWGSCAGAILLAKEIEGPVAAGWLGLDGMDIRIARNGFGRQV